MERIILDCPPLGEISLLKSPQVWVAKTNIEQYAIRQAQSCEYLKTLFPVIERRAARFPQIELPLLLDPLLAVHDRQFAELTAAVSQYKSSNRDSYYFNEMYRRSGLGHPMSEDLLDKEQLLRLVAVHGFSYVRGADRYVLLKEYQAPENDPFRNIWRDFYQDASGNWQRSWEFMTRNFDVAGSVEVIREVAMDETETMQKIWGHNGVQ